MMRKRTPDRSQARSLVEASEEEMTYVNTLSPTLQGASTIIRGIYENFRRLGEALLLIDGREGDHEECVAVLVALRVTTTRSLPVLDNLRRLRHDINYRGYRPSLADLDDVLSIRDACWKPILEEVKKRIR